MLVASHRNTDCDYSAAYVTLYTDYGLVGHGMTFTIGRGTDIVSHQDVSLFQTRRRVSLAFPLVKSGIAPMPRSV